MLMQFYFHLGVCKIKLAGGLCCAGLRGCSRLQQLYISGCHAEHLVACRVLRRMTELGLRFDNTHHDLKNARRSLMRLINYVAAAMPQLVSLDISHNNLRQACMCIGCCKSCTQPIVHAQSPGLILQWHAMQSPGFVQIRGPCRHCDQQRLHPAGLCLES